MNIRQATEIFGKSSYRLHTDGVWPEFIEALQDCRSFLALERLKEEYKSKAKKEHWNDIFIAQMHEEFQRAEVDLAEFLSTENQTEAGGIGRNEDTTMNINEAFPSNYLKATDIKGREPVVTISNWKVEKMGEDDKLVIYFEGKEKGVVLNKTNATNIATMYGPETDNWIGKRIKLVTAWVDFQGRSMEAIRIRPPDAEAQPKPDDRNPPPADPDDEVPF